MNHHFKPFPELTSERLFLTQLTSKHTKAIFDYQSNKKNFPYSTMTVYTDIAQAETYINKMNNGVDQGKWIIWAICLQGTEEIIGTVSIWNLNHEKNCAEYGYGLFPNYRHKGYMQEALGVTSKYAFECMGIDSLEAYTSHYHQASKSLLRKCDFTFLKTVEDDYSDGALMDLYVLQKPSS